MVRFAKYAKFPLGKILATYGALCELERSGETALPHLVRHAAGDWGEICEEDKKLNDAAIQSGERILSAYTLRNGVRIWIITEADRSATTILLPDEY